MKTAGFNGNYLLDMFVFTLVDNKELEFAIPFYYRSKRLGFNNRLNFIFNDKDVFKTVLTKDPSLLFQDALTRSEIVYYEYKNNYKLFGANYNNNFKFYYPDLLDDYELYLQKNEGNIYTLPSCGLTTTETIRS